MNYVAFFSVGALTSFAMAMAALRFYVSIENPYLVWAASFVLLGLLMVLTRIARRKVTPLSTAIAIVVLEGTLFAIGAALALYGLLAIYPMNN